MDDQLHTYIGEEEAITYSTVVERAWLASGRMAYMQALLSATLWNYLRSSRSWQ